MSGALSPHMKVKKGRPLAGFPNTDPVVTITVWQSSVPVGVPQASGEFVATAVDAEQGDIASTLDWTTKTANATAGVQVVNVGGGETGGNVTGLANDATVYTATIDVDGAASPQAIAVTGSAAQIFSTLITELDSDTTGASWSIVGGNLVATSDATGATSDIALVDTDLFSSLTPFVAILASVPGVDDVFGSIGTGAAPALTFPLDGAQTITATATDGFLATDSDAKAVTVSV